MPNYIVTTSLLADGRSSGEGMLVICKRLGPSLLSALTIDVSGPGTSVGVANGWTFTQFDSILILIF
jgi:hypothetical protein